MTGTDREPPMADLLSEHADLIANTDIDAEPVSVTTCRSTEEVVRAVTAAAASGLPVAVRGGGYSPAGLGTVDGGTVIDVGPLDRVTVDPATRTFSICGAALTGAVGEELSGFGLAATVPVVSRAGVVGSALNGGVGHLVRKLGLVCDAMIGATVVTASGEVVDASAPEHADLLWALRGGGGNFGVVTEMVLQAHELREVTLAQYIFPIDAAADVLRFYRDWSAGIPDDLTAVTLLRTMPPDPAVAPEHVGRPVLSVNVVHAGAAEDAERDLAPLAEFEPALVRRSLRVPLGQLHAISNAAFPHARFGVITRSGWVDDLSDDAIDEAVAVSAGMPPGESVFELVRMQGAISRVDASFSAAPDRDAAFYLNVVGLWLDPEDGEAVREWVAEADRRSRPMRRSDAVAAGFAAKDELGLAEATFGSFFERLRDVKRRYDPDNIFARNLNIRP
jgi:FAD/FMN-containing dehydrogenase